MNKENQHTEWKATWRDEYLKWVCGFANAEGGTLSIGKNDDGSIGGLPNARKLMEDLPNKIRDILGIIVAVNLFSEKGKEWIAIEVEGYPFPVNYKGRYFRRSGSTNQELKGAALDRFLLQKQGKHWDGVPVPKVSAKDLESSAFGFFKNRASRSKRISAADLREGRNGLLDKLHLTEAGYLKRAALLLFHADPERFVTGAYIKIGFFESDVDLRYQDEIHGHLFLQVEKTMDLLLTKYLKAEISYEGLQRVETYPFPEEALREALLNAVAHKDYSSGNPIQISVYENKIIFWNAGQLPENWTVERLMKTHPSVPFNPGVANAFFRAGMIESWGRGTLKIMEECRQAGVPVPGFKYDLSGFWIEFEKPFSDEKVSGDMSGKVSGKTSEMILQFINENENITAAEMAGKMGITKRTVERNLQKLQKEGGLIRVGSRKRGKWQIIHL
ncbi:MAG TPA: HTH domain-containing protein [Bacteroidetes bacterium]|nr:HTH domain-containing protein [Bacteroidota bacterium]